MPDDWEMDAWTTSREMCSKKYLKEEVSAAAGGASVSTNFTVVKVDVGINGLDEATEESVGAYLAYVADTNGVMSAAGTNAMAGVKFTCEPTDLPPDEMVTIRNAGHGELYLKEGDLLYLVTSTNLPARGIDKRTFLLHGHAASGAVLKDEITIEHPSSKAKDLAKYTVVEFDFIAISRNRRPGSSFNQLTDNREADITITLKPAGVNFSHFSLNFKSEPVESGELINKMGTGVTFTPSGTPLVWSTSPVYWYGVKPDKECHRYEYAYRFTLMVAGVPVREHEYEMCWPDEKPEFIPDEVAHTKLTVDAPVYVDGVGYVCQVTVAPYIKGGSLIGLPVTHQYADEAEVEERFHEKQWLGQVPLDKGGQGDCLTPAGVVHFLFKNHPESVIRNGDSAFVVGATAIEAERNAASWVDAAEHEEFDTSIEITSADHLFSEKKAKEEAGYNAAWRYHCTYEWDSGVHDPKNHAHPAYIENGGDQ